MRNTYLYVMTRLKEELARYLATGYSFACSGFGNCLTNT